MAFEKYWAEKAEYDRTHLREMVKVVPANSPRFNNNILLKSIYDVPNMGNDELRSFIRNNIHVILNNIFFGSQDVNVYVQCFTDVRFLEAFIDVIVSIPTFEKDHIVKINMICYQYITLNPSNRDKMVSDRMLKISSIINRGQLPRLLGLGLSGTFANSLLIARYSDLDLNICVRRVDFAIINQPKVLMSHDMIMEIFRTLYNIMADWVKIFQYVMFDVIPEYDDNENGWVTPEIEEVDSTLSLVILDILNDLPSAMIRSTLLNYASGYDMVNNQKKIRFSMQRLSDDYSRINDAVYALKTYEGIYVP